MAPQQNHTSSKPSQVRPSADHKKTTKQRQTSVRRDSLVAKEPTTEEREEIEAEKKKQEVLTEYYSRPPHERSALQRWHSQKKLPKRKRSTPDDCGYMEWYLNPETGVETWTKLFLKRNNKVKVQRK